MVRYLPDDKVIISEDVSDALEENIKIPNELEPLKNEDWINLETGINNSGDIDSYMPLLKIFFTSIEEKADEIEKFYNDNDLNNYTIKVHALKSSARIIGATEFGDEAQKLEDAGKTGDESYIKDNHDKFMALYRSLKEPLSKVFYSDYESDSNKPEADRELLKDVYNEIKAAASDFDCETLQTIFDEMNDYRIPDSDKDVWDKINDAFQKYDYDGILDIIDRIEK